MLLIKSTLTRLGLFSTPPLLPLAVGQPFLPTNLCEIGMFCSILGRHLVFSITWWLCFSPKNVRRSFNENSSVPASTCAFRILNPESRILNLDCHCSTLVNQCCIRARLQPAAKNAGKEGRLQGSRIYYMILVNVCQVLSCPETFWTNSLLAMEL